jgi:mannose-6-phosphate isomerase
MPSLYPLRFEPIFRRYIWGGRRLGTVLGKAIGPEDDYAESWEIVDHGADQSRVIAGPLAGKTLGEIVTEHGAELFGGQPKQATFPLLFKFLDANTILSVQVHPNDEQAGKLTPPDAGKTEAWVVLAAEPGSAIYAGLKRGFDRAALARELARGTCELCLNRFEPRVGDCILLPAGTVHALGAGLLIAEIQQSSDTTYRLFDWNRVGPDGRPRALHIDEALDVIDHDRGPVMPAAPVATDRPQVTRLTACDKFVLDRWQIALPREIGGDNRFHILSVIEGSATAVGDPVGKPLATGDTILLPAAAGPLRVEPAAPSATILDIYLP